MSRALKKTHAVIAGLTVLMTGQINALDANTNPGSPESQEKHNKEPSCCEPKRADVPSPCCKPMCRPSPYSGVNCLPAPYCQEVNLRGELLYWTAELDGLQAAFGKTSIHRTVDKGITKTTIRETDKHPDWEWRPGFRIGADYAFQCFVLETDWTHYMGHAKFHEHGKHGHWRLKYDTLDFLFGRRFSIAPCFYFKPFIGVRTAWIRQRLKSHLETEFRSNREDSTIFTTKDDKEKFWGVGPELGLEADWYIACNFSLYASVDVVSYYGQVRAHIHNEDVFTDTVSDNHGKIRRPFNQIGTDGSIGLRWDKAWPVASEVLLTIKLGVEQHRIYDFSQLGSDGTLSMDGANLAASIGYRW
jgi:hypothetical protein